MPNHDVHLRLGAAPEPRMRPTVRGARMDLIYLIYWLKLRVDSLGKSGAGCFLIGSILPARPGLARKRIA